MVATSTDQLIAAIRAVCGNAGIEWRTPPQPLTGGFYAEMWRVELVGDPALRGALVARVLPEPAGARREIAVQRHMSRAGFPTPTVRLSGEPGEHLDRPWMLMDHVDGSPLLSGLSGPSALLRLPTLMRTIPDTLARCAAQLHAIDASPLHAELGGRDELVDFITGMRDGMRSAVQPDLVALADDLLATLPGQRRVAVCHGDLHPFNVLATVTVDTLIDWTTARITDPIYDVAFTHLLLSHPALEAPPALRPVIDFAGRRIGHRFLRSYVKHAGTPVDEALLNWFTLASALRILVEIANLRAAPNANAATHPFSSIEIPLRRLITLAGVG